MAVFDWETFLRNRKIEFVTAGHTRGNVGVACPFCGDADQGHHLGINLKGRGWYCWRNRAHRGIKPHRLIQALLRCSYFEVQRIVGDGASPLLAADESFGSHIRSKLSGEFQQPRAREAIRFPREIHRLHNCSEGVGRLFLGYLCARGYSREEVYDLCGLYDLHYAMRGDFAYRVIFPVRMAGELVTWTGRSISPATEPKYRTLVANEEKHQPGAPLAIHPIKDCLWNMDDLVEDVKRVLVVTEGPFDAMRLDYFGHRYGVRATCLFGKTISDEQLYWLEDIGSMYEEKYIMLDPDASLDLLSIMDRIGFLGFRSRKLPSGFADPAELSPVVIKDLFSS